MNLRIRLALPLAAMLIALVAIPAAAQAAAGVHITWKAGTRLEQVSKSGFGAVSCPTGGECVAVDESGRVVYSKNPKAETVKAWHFETIDKGAALTGVSCPTTKFCVAVDSGGKLFHATRPAEGEKMWARVGRVATVKLAGGAYAGFSGISCPTTSLCVATDSSTSGGVYVSTDPLGSASSWHHVSLGSGVSLSSVSCNSATMCVVGGSREEYSTDPASGSWHLGSKISNGAVDSLACPSISICAGVGYNHTDLGIAFATGKAAGTTWTRTNLESQPPGPDAGIMDGIACSNPGFCVAVDSNDNAYTSAHVAKGKWNAGSPIRKNSDATRSVISCKDSTCVVLDSRGVEMTGVISK